MSASDDDRRRGKVSIFTSNLLLSALNYLYKFLHILKGGDNTELSRIINKIRLKRPVCICGKPLVEVDDNITIGTYPHEGGMEIDGVGYEWVYIKCPSCHYDYALNHLQSALNLK